MSQSNPLVPFIPLNAPFSEEQRSWLNGFLAGLYSRASAPQALGDTPQSKTPLTILWGSQTGNAESLAKKTAKDAKAKGYRVEVFDMDEYPKDRLPKESNLLIITSTYGDGEPPDNAEAFHQFVLGDGVPKLDQVRYSVLGLGDSNYPDFNKCAKEFDGRLAALGAQRAAGGVWCDVEFDDDYAAWRDAALEGFLGEAAAPASTEPMSESAPASEAKSAYNRNNPYRAKLLSNSNLNKEGSAKETRHVEICLKGSGLEYEAGDALGIIPQNCKALVDDILQVTGFSGEEIVPGAADDEVCLRDALLSHYDINTLNKGLLESYAALVHLPELDAMIASQNGHIDAYLKDRHLIDLLHAYPAKLGSASDFVRLLRKLSPRLYSISSSPKAYDEQVHLTVGVVRYYLHGRPRKGVCSNFLAELEPGTELSVYVQPNKHFKPPANASIPMIMVGPGTGIAPFRAFLEERHASEAPGKNWLIFGDQRSEYDFLYAEQLESMQTAGTLHALDTAFSRDGEEKVYVQNRMREKAAELYQWLEEGAYFYVCGDASRMAKDVDAALRDIIREQGKLTEDETEAYMDRLKSQKRYLRDVY